ncbi:MAG: valine--tRNA ligase [Pseudomonadota bacterium]
MLDKTYDPAEIEQRIYENWTQENVFACGHPGRVKAGAKPYCIVIPPPNVTGSLHMGHALNNTIQDILTRFERMRGKDVLWQPGMDHAGIATQMVVERQLMERQEPDRHALGREAFIQRIWDWKEDSGGTIVNQLKRLGASCDWSRERFTMDEGLSQAVRKVFVELYREGLIYKDKRLVNWDPVFHTAISDLEVETKEVDGSMWWFAYPLVEGPVDGLEEIVIATTRPETMLGDGAVAVHPSDERYKNLIGKMVRLPIAERHIPIIADEYPDPEFGTGAVKITGAHDFNDFEVARRNNIPLIKLMDEQARMISTPENHVPKHYHEVDRYEARKMVLQEIEDLGFYRGKEDKVIAQPFGDRSKVVIEPMLTEQWYVNAEKLAQPALKAVQDGKTVFVPKNWEKTYYEWMNNIQPWCISRQLWWGHQIPAWYGPDDKVFVGFDEEDARAQAVQHYGKDDVVLHRDPDVLDTWFSSALWPFSTLGWPEQTPELGRYYKTDVLVTGFDIIFFWIARMMMMGLHFMKEVPFHTVYIHALVRDENGKKMSKSEGNVLDPLDLIQGIDIDTLVEKRTKGLRKPEDAPKIAKATRKEFPDGIKAFGADALRFTLAAMAAQGRDVKLSTSRIEGYRNFATKIWNASRFSQMNECIRVEGFDPANVQQTINKWIAGETERTAKTVTENIEAHRYNDAANALYHFIWHVFCDWYLELIKPILNEGDSKAQSETRATTAWALDQVLKLLHPFMPFLTEELWMRLAEYGPDRKTLLALADWPDYTGLINKKADEEINWVIRLISEVRSVRSEMNVPAGAKIPLVITGANAQTIARVECHEDTIKRLARLESFLLSNNVPKGAVQIVLDEATIGLSLVGIIDIEQESERLKREIEKVTSNIERISSKLSNDKFVANAPKDVVNQEKERKAEALHKQSKLKGALERLQTLN